MKFKGELLPVSWLSLANSIAFPRTAVESVAEAHVAAADAVASSRRMALRDGRPPS